MEILIYAALIQSCLWVVLLVCWFKQKRKLKDEIELRILCEVVLYVAFERNPEAQFVYREMLRRNNKKDSGFTWD